MHVTEEELFTEVNHPGISITCCLYLCAKITICSCWYTLMHTPFCHSLQVWTGKWDSISYFHDASLSSRSHHFDITWCHLCCGHRNQLLIDYQKINKENKHTLFWFLHSAAQSLGRLFQDTSKEKLFVSIPKDDIEWVIYIQSDKGALLSRDSFLAHWPDFAKWLSQHRRLNIINITSYAVILRKSH